MGNGGNYIPPWSSIFDFDRGIGSFFFFHFYIPHRYKLPPNDNYQRKILAFFVLHDDPGKIDRTKLIDFLENSKLQYKKYVEAKSQEDANNLRPPNSPKVGTNFVSFFFQDFHEIKQSGIRRLGGL